METIDILKNFLDDNGRLKSFPAKRKMKIYALIYLSAKFETGTTYTEREVNEILGNWHSFADPATLRRELYDYHFLDRSADGRVYRLAQPLPTSESPGL